MYQGKYARKKGKGRKKGGFLKLLVWLMILALVAGGAVFGFRFALPFLSQGRETTAQVPVTEPVQTTVSPTTLPPETEPVVLLDPSYDGFPAFPGMAQYMQGDKPYLEGNREEAPFLYPAFDVFWQTEVDHINVYVTGVQAVDDQQYMTVSVLDTRTVQVVREYPFYAQADALGSMEPQRIVSLYPREPVLVEANQTLVFSKAGDPLSWGYLASEVGENASLQGFYSGENFAMLNRTDMLCIDVYTKEPAPNSPEEKALRAALEGKKLSILGDSISTFMDWSNSTAVNDTLGENDLYYDSLDKLQTVEQTWWKQAADRYGMEILVNNSWSQSSVTSIQEMEEESYGWNTRPGNLHDNTLKDNPGGTAIAPDIIAVYMGTNDLVKAAPCNADGLDEAFWARIEAEGFVPSQEHKIEEAFALMVYKVRKSYPDATIFLFNNPTMIWGYETTREAFNQVIEIVAQRYSCHVVDLHSTPLSQYEPYTLDGMHPNAEGMDLMTQAFAEKLREVYLIVK